MMSAEAVLRANANYELVLLDRLDPQEREFVVGEEPAAYGLLRPVDGSGLEPRVVSTDTALLFMTLAQPGPCPGYVRAALGDRLDDAIGRLILDSVLEIEREGSFRTGADAWRTPALTGEVRANGRIAKLSLAAVRYAQALSEMPSGPLGSWLYMFGRRPVTPERRRRLPDAAAVARFLFASNSQASTKLRSAWQEIRGADDTPWRSWHPRRSGAASARSPGARATSFKLYVSPDVDALPEAIEAVAVSLADAPGIASFKTGRTVDQLVRPDKLVVYFARQDDLLDAATRLQVRLAGAPAHGVPFTAGITSDGLLSWGVDPPRATSPRDISGSWRSWVTGRLADYLVAARNARPPAQPWEIALERLRLDGVDIETWVPTAGAVR
jgi:hypothetical protein